ncbi:hypothetical protein H2198_007229 [Neophaeococcomyces mojaviensis]|uniref:Uncharacterized protein n=1 Tax=Neophaeococcomyces mojaviensis TaxID=3383035 RepID=A0ACC3A0K2_9EURO|nr:hypothetical protein H2198_007229 [Knufia sp. JES_112]
MEPEQSAFDTYFKRILADRNVIAHQPPSVRSFDEKIESIGGTTFALELQPRTLQAQKRLPRPTYEQRLVELVRETAFYKRELRYFRTVFQAVEDMQDGVQSVMQQLILNYYLVPNAAEPAKNQFLQLADELDSLLQRYTSVVNDATQDWIDLVQQLPRPGDPAMF